MADRRLEERLQPSLLDRLTDERPGDPQEAREERGIDTRRLRQIIQRDLSWLLNTNNLETRIDANAFPQSTESVLNYGVREVSGDFSTERRALEIRDAIREAIAKFEPRVNPGSLDVVLRSEDNKRETVITFDIRGDMWAQPIPVDLYLRSEVDLTTGALTLESNG